MGTRLACSIVIATFVAACGSGDGGGSGGTLSVGPDADPVVAQLATTSTSTSTTATTSTSTTATTAPAVERFVTQAWVPFGSVGDIVLHHPSDRIETIGFHQSNHEGARPIEVLETAVRPIQLDDRGRASHQQSAADIAVAPDHPIRAPVSGVVKRSGGYVLYCDETDDYAVIEPDGHPGIEVKILHMVDVSVGPGQRVEAGVTVIASASRVLPFVSDVDEFTGEPSSPHVHVEVVDTAIPNVPSPNSGSEDC